MRVRADYFGTQRYFKLAPGIALLLIYVLLKYNDFMKYTTDWGLAGLTIIATFLAATAEEVAFRLYLFNLFVQDGYQKYRAVILSSILFSLLHLVNIFRYGDIWAVINQLIVAFFMGVLLCSLYSITRSILFVSVYHFIVNVPAALRRITEDAGENLTALKQPTLMDNIISTILYILIYSPLIIVALYYLNMHKKKNAI